MNIQENSGHTALIYASAEGYTEIVRMLLQRGADVNYIIRGNTALVVATKRGHTEIVRMLKQAGAN